MRSHAYIRDECASRNATKEIEGLYVRRRRLGSCPDGVRTLTFLSSVCQLGEDKAQSKIDALRVHETHI